MNLLFHVATLGGCFALCTQVFGACYTLGQDAPGRCMGSECEVQCTSPVTPEPASIPGFELRATREGYLISSIVPASPGAQQGLQIGDHILSIDGHPLPLPEPALWDQAVFHTLSVRRSGTMLKFKLNGEKPSVILARYLKTIPEVRVTNLPGLDYGVQLNPEGIDHRYISGILIARDSTSRVLTVIPASPAADAGIQEGDLVFLDIKGKPVLPDARTARKLEGASAPESFSVIVERAGHLSYRRLSQRSILSVLGGLPSRPLVDSTKKVLIARTNLQ